MNDDVEKEIEALTFDLWKHCVGKNAVAVVGAGLNLVMSAAQTVPDKAVRSGMILGFREIVINLEQQNSDIRQ